MQCPSASLICVLFATILLGCENDQNPTERILFSSSRNGNSDIFLMDTSGTQITPIISSAAEEWSPVWLNENEIGFLRQGTSNQIEQYRYDLKTKEESLMTQPKECNLKDQIMSYRSTTKTAVYTCNGEIYVHDTETNLTKYVSPVIRGTCSYTSWASDTSIIYTNNQTGNNEIYLLDLNTMQIRNLTNHESNDQRGVVSPDGSYMAFSSNRVNDYHFDIHLMDLMTGNIECLTNQNGSHLSSYWSKDGNRLYIGSGVEGNWDIYVYDITNDQFIRLTSNPAFDGEPQVW